MCRCMYCPHFYVNIYAHVYVHVYAHVCAHVYTYTDTCVTPDAIMRQLRPSSLHEPVHIPHYLYYLCSNTEVSGWFRSLYIAGNGPNVAVLPNSLGKLNSVGSADVVVEISDAITAANLLPHCLSGQDRAQHSMAGQTGQGGAGQHRTAKGRAGQDRTGQDRVGQDRTGQGRTA